MSEKFDIDIENIIDFIKNTNDISECLNSESIIDSLLKVCNNDNTDYLIKKYINNQNDFDSLLKLLIFIYPISQQIIKNLDITLPDYELYSLNFKERLIQSCITKYEFLESLDYSYREKIKILKNELDFINNLTNNNINKELINEINENEKLIISLEYDISNRRKINNIDLITIEINEQEKRLEKLKENQKIMKEKKEKSKKQKIDTSKLLSELSKIINEQ